MTAPFDEVVAATAEVRVNGGRMGTAILIDGTHLLTARHVVEKAIADPAKKIEVVFPNLSDPLDVTLTELAPGHSIDVAVLALASPVPVHVRPVGLTADRRVPSDVEVFGFPRAEALANGVWRSFHVSHRTTLGTVQLDWQDAGTLPGHSGGPVLAPDAGLVGILVEGAQTARFDRFLPLDQIQLVWSGLRRPWHFAGQSARAHATQRARGQRGGFQAEDRFQGREASLEKARAWIEDDVARGQVLVVTGQPGSGKSAVLARVALTVSGNPSTEPGLYFHARDATVPDLVEALSVITGIDTRADGEDFLREFGFRSDVPETTVLVDALDEASTTFDMYSMAELLERLSRNPNVRIVVATRARAGSARYAPETLLGRLGVFDSAAENLIDLDRPPYADSSALQRYAEAVLIQSGASNPAPPHGAWESYRHDAAVRTRLVSLIATGADRSFLVAALTADWLSRQMTRLDPDDPGSAGRIPRTVGEALEKNLTSLGREEEARVRALLTALSFARGSGVTDSLWLRFTRALGYDIAQPAIDSLRQTGAIDYLLTSTDEGADSEATRLFHEALIGQLRRMSNGRFAGEMYEAVLAEVSAKGGWANVPYAKLHAAEHALEAGRLADLLVEPGYFAEAEPVRLETAVRSLARSTERTAALRALEVLRDPAVRDREGYVALGRMKLSLAPLPVRSGVPRWEPVWASWSTTFTGDLTARLDDAIENVAFHVRNGRRVVFASSRAGQVVAYDDAEGIAIWSHRFEDDVVTSAFSPDGAILAVTLANGTTVGLDTEAGKETWRFVHTGTAPSVLAVARHGDTQLVATGTYNEGLDEKGRMYNEAGMLMGVVRLWVVAGTASARLEWTKPCFGAGVMSLEFGEEGGSAVLVTSGDTHGEVGESPSPVRLLSVRDGSLIADLPLLAGTVQAVATVGGEDVYAVSAQLLARWRPGAETRSNVSPVSPGAPKGIWAARHRGRFVLALRGWEEPIIVDGESLDTLTQPYSAYGPLTAMTIGGDNAGETAALVTGDGEGRVRVWDIDSLAGSRVSSFVRIAMATVDATGGFVVAVVDNPPPRVEVRRISDGAPLQELALAPSVVRSIRGGMVLLGYGNGQIELRRLPDLTIEWTRQVHEKRVTGFAVRDDLLLSSGSDGSVRLSDLATGARRRDPVQASGWRDKGVDDVVIVEIAGSEQRMVVASGYSFGLATWDLGEVLERGDESGRKLDRHGVVSAAAYTTLVQAVRLGGNEGLAIVERYQGPDGSIRLVEVTGAKADQTWAASDHAVTAIAQGELWVWTADSWGDVRCWPMPADFTAPSECRMEIKLGAHVIGMWVLEPDGVIVATHDGVVRLKVTL